MKNDGSINAMIGTLSNSTLTTDQAKYLDYTVTYSDGAEIEQYDKLDAGDTETLKVRVEFKLDPEELPATASAITLNYASNYVQADTTHAKARNTVTPPVVLSIGDTVTYTTSLNNVELSNWKVFYIDGDYTYIILDDYLQNEAISNMIKTNYNLSTYGTYSVYANNNRTDLIEAMEAESGNWDSLLTGTINGHAVNQTRTANVWAMGTPTLDLWVNSWNSKYPSDTLYTRYIDTEDIDNSNFYATGYVVGDSENPTSTYIGLLGRTGYNNTLYYPHQTDIDNSRCYGYWLASPSASHANRILLGYCGGDIGWRFYDDSEFAFRPVVCLPSSIINQ